MYAVLHPPNFAAQVAAQQRPELRKHAFALVDGERPADVVIAANKAARSFGVEAGMSRLWHDKIDGSQELRQKLDVRSLTDFSEWVYTHSVWMRFISEIANGTKHVRNRQSFESMRVASLPFSFDTPHAGFDEGTWDGPVRYVQGSIPLGKNGKGYLLLDLGEGAAEHRWLYTENLLEVSVRFWRDFFRLYLPKPEVLASKHHVD
jgi:hypothetical protein